MASSPVLAGSPPEGKSEARIFAGRYQVVRILKQGKGIETLLATELEQGRKGHHQSRIGQVSSAGAQMRLEHEAGVVRQIRSPGFAPLLHLGREGDQLFLVMGLVPGITLAERLTHGALAVRERVNLGRCLLSALQEIHDHGVLHRDLKPANMIVNEEGPLQTGRPSSTSAWPSSSRLDAAIRDQPVGTARYMSPEQAGLLGQDIDERLDLYSIGVVLFERLAGRPPFKGETVGEVLRQHMTLRPPELRSLGLAIRACFGRS